MVTELCDSLLIDLQDLENDVSTASDLNLPVEPLRNAAQGSSVVPMMKTTLVFLFIMKEWKWK